MLLFNYIVWSANPDIFNLGNITVRWYGVLFALGFLIAQQIILHIYKKEGKPEADVETLTIYIVVATILGARLGHVLFYEPERYLPNPLDILKVWEGGLASHGAALGILIALYLYVNYDIRMGLFPPKFKAQKKKREEQSYLWVVDKIVIGVAIGGALIRFGNFMNSEIIGIPTNTQNYGVVFGRSAEHRILSSNTSVESVNVYATENNQNQKIPEGLAPVTIEVQFKDENYREPDVRNYIESEVNWILASYQSIRENIHEPMDSPLNYRLTQDERGAFVAHINTLGIPRHPSQLYESASMLIIFFILLFLWNLKKEKTKEGLLFGIFLVTVFGLRFIYEFFKEDQVDFEATLPLNMGQWLSIPLVLAGIYLLANLDKFQPKEKKQKARS
jgi:phosphatidylglycerol---prolipoprotein diacylglyceryl transferase